MRAKVAIITGAANGLGSLIRAALMKEGYEVVGFDREYGDDVCNPAATLNLDDLPHVDLLVNCAGINRIDWLDDVTDADWDEVLGVNAKGIFKMTQYLKGRLSESNGTVLNIVSNAAHMPMRCSAAYNASKGAALILSKQLARELIGDGITVFSISPNKLAGTGMSDDIDRQVMAVRGWSRDEAQSYQLAGLLTGEETDPVALAEFAGFLLSTKARHKALAGCDIPYGL